MQTMIEELIGNEEYMMSQVKDKGTYRSALESFLSEEKGEEDEYDADYKEY